MAIPMESVVTDGVCPESPPVVESHDIKSTESAENFQKFMYELFEKNGVLNDLRAYLRGHIVGLLRSAKTGEPPPCQKHFTQRLELPYQALNMLVSEYLLKLEFSYTLSVFISEIPLANMVFTFAKSLLQSDHTDSMLRFSDEDIWTVLNFLGVKCDSEHAANIVEMYRAEHQLPLLLCLIKSTPLYKEPLTLDDASSHDSVASNTSRVSCCKHALLCNTCRDNMLRIKLKYKNRESTKAKKGSSYLHHVDSLMKNIDVIERSLIDEMFQQLKSVYEAEIKMLKTEEDQRVKRSLATHAVQLRRKRAEMEESFRSRELELENSVQQKKRFLWGLARLLREQHKQMDKAMQDIQEETNRLNAKEDSLKSQLTEAERFLRQRGEDMRLVISDELGILEGHLDSMKRERDNINKERSELEHMKHQRDGTAKTTNIETAKEDLRSHYDLLKNEFNILKVYLKSAKLEPKCVMERSTLTETADGSLDVDATLNNGLDLVRVVHSEDKVKAKKLVNDLKKMKNVNFSQSNPAEINRERSRSSTASSEVGDARTREELRRLIEENERLRIFAKQQREHIDELSSQRARMAAELTAARAPLLPPTPRPRTAPPVTERNTNLFNFGNVLPTNASTSEVSRGHGWRMGAGEEMSFFANAHPRIIVPGDTLPFIGVLSNRHNDNRRYLINQWRSLRRRMSPVGGVAKSPTVAGASGSRDADIKVCKERPSSGGVSASKPCEVTPNTNSDTALKQSDKTIRDQYEQRPKSPDKSKKERERCPKFILSEAKENIKTKNYSLRRPASEREQSPNTVLRDARLRLRKLEIEAEAVEKSYMHFRKKRETLISDKHAAKDDGSEHSRTIETELKQHKKSPKSGETQVIGSASHYLSHPTAAVEQIIEDINEYQTKYDIGVTHYKNKNLTSVKVKPIPPAYACEALHITKRNKNYLDTPLPEFKKYYHSEKRVSNERFFEERLRTDTMSLDFQSATTSYLQRASNEMSSPATPSPTNHKHNESRGAKCSSPKSETNGFAPKPLKSRDNSNDHTSPMHVDIKNRPRSPKAKGVTKTIRHEVFRHAKQNKAKELEILKQNISMIYNISEQTMADNSADFNNATANWNMEKDGERNVVIIDDTISEASREENSEVCSKKSSIEDKNILRVELQSVTHVSDVKITGSQSQELVMMLESSVGNAEESDAEIKYTDAMPTQMTILVSPEKSDSVKSEEIVFDDKAGEESVKIDTKTLDSDVMVRYDSIQADAIKNVSRVEIMEPSNDALVPILSDLEGSEEPDYQDDFSADVDNRGSNKYDTDLEHSPISMPKTSEDDNFWDP